MTLARGSEDPTTDYHLERQGGLTVVRGSRRINSFLTRPDTAGPLRVGVVGGGYWGSKHLRVLSGLGDVEPALIEPDDRRRESLSGQFGKVPSFEQLDDALPYLDAVVIATPPQMHAEHASAALRAGCHVMVEKPLATTVAEAEHIVSLAESLGLVLMVGHTFEYNPAVWKLRSILDSGELGSLLYLETERLNLGLYQSDVNVIWDLAPHDISIANFLLRTEPSTVAVWAQSHTPQCQPDVASVRLGYADSDLTVTMRVSWLYPRKVRATTVVGHQRMAVYNDTLEEDRIRIFDKGVSRPYGDQPITEKPVDYHYGDIVSIFVPNAEPLMIEDEHFVHCARNGLRPLSDGVSGLQVVRVLEATDRALADGTVVPVGPTIDLRSDTTSLIQS